MSQKRTRGVGSTRVAGATRITDEQVAVRAYERWMGRGCPHSDGLEDWVAARRELEAEVGQRGPRAPAPKPPAKAKAAPSPASIH